LFDLSESDKIFEKKVKKSHIPFGIANAEFSQTATTLAEIGSTSEILVLIFNKVLLKS